MKIRATHLQPYRLLLRDPWLTASGAFSWREGWLLQVETDCGRSGYGDCAPLPATGTESPQLAEVVLRERTRLLVGMSVDDALAALDAPESFQAPAARCAIESALLDLLAQSLGVPFRRYLAADAADQVQVNAALGSLQQLDERAVRSACQQGYSVLKLKVGIGPVDDELFHLRNIAEQLPAGTQLRLDANGAWNEPDAARFIAGCADLPVDMLEEPLADPSMASLARLQSQCVFALAVDESWSLFAATDQFFAAPPVRRLVLKPPRSGGLLPALALAKRASAAALQCVVTSSMDSACGVIAAAQLAAALDNSLAHGLATSSWFAEDLGAAPEITAGRLNLPVSAGLGFVPTQHPEEPRQ